MYPDKELLSRKEVCTFCKIDYRTASKMFTFKNNYISVATLARELSWFIKSKGGQANENAVSGVNGDRNIYNHRDTESCRFTQLGYLANGCNYFDCDRVNLAVRLDCVHIAGKEKEM